MKRLIALLLCVNILLSTIPLGALAEEVIETLPEETEFVQESTACTETTACTENTEPSVPEESQEESVPETMTATEATESVEEMDSAQTDPESEEEETLPEETPDPEEEETFWAGEVQTWICEEELPGEEEYFAAYAESQFYESSATFGIAAGRTLDAGHKKIYDALAPVFREIASGQRTSAMVPVGEFLGDTVTVTLSDGKSVSVPCNPAEPVNIRTVNLDLSQLLRAILADFPYELYWFDKTVGVSAIPVTSGSGKVCIGFYFSICPQYRKNSLSGKKYHLPDYELKTAKTSAAVTAAANARAIVEEFEALSDYEKLLAYKNRLCDLTEYNHSAISSSYSGGYGDPWQMIWVFDKDTTTKVVCEGYSKAFQYLCDMSTFTNDVVCYSVTGYLNGGDHMWNIVTINDSRYLVDVTNCDTGNALFLRGGKPNSSGVYTIAGQTFRYREESKELWGTGADSILTLETTDFDPTKLPQNPGTPEPDEPEETQVWTGQMLVEAMGTEGRFSLTADVVIDTQIILPEFVTLDVCSPYTITVAEGGSLIAPGKIEITDGGKLKVAEGGSLINSGEMTVAESGIFVNDGTVTNNGSITSYTAMTGMGMVEGTPVAEYMGMLQLKELLAAGGDVLLSKPLILTESLTIPLGTQLIVNSPVSLVIAKGGSLAVHGALRVSGETALVKINAGGKLTNCGNIEVKNNATLNMAGSYAVEAKSRLKILYTCDAEGVVTRATVSGMKPECLTVIAQTAGDDAVIREAIGYVQSLAKEVGGFDIRFAGNTVLSSDLELPGNSDPVILANAVLTVPEGMTLTDRSGMGVYGKLIALGKVTAPSWPIMLADSTCLENPENCDNFYFDNLLLEDLPVTAEATTVLSDGTVVLKVGDGTPVGAKYFGHFRVDAEPVGLVNWTISEDRTVQVRSKGGPCAVTVTVSATDANGTVLKNSAGKAISKKFPLRFATEKVCLYQKDGKADFYEKNKTWGLYPGSSLSFYANVTGKKGEADKNMNWEIPTVSGDIASVTLKNGILTLTAAKTLSKAETIVISVTDPSGVSKGQEYVVSLRPRAQKVGLALNKNVVTGQKVTFDLNRQDKDVLMLTPVTTPSGACSIGGFRADGKTPQAKWKSSSTAIATVENGKVTFTGKTGSVSITMTANFGSSRDLTAKVTFNVVKLPQAIRANKETDKLIGGSSVTYKVYDVQNTTRALKSSEAAWFLCDENGNPVDYHPYASVSASGKLTTKAVADEDTVYLMAKVAGYEDSACLSKPLKVTLYPAITAIQILNADGDTVQNTTIPVEMSERPVLTWSGGEAGAVKSVAWKSSSTAVATISSKGVITPKKAGTAKFTLTVTALNGKKATANVTMKFGIFADSLKLSVLKPGEKTATTNLTDLTLNMGASMTFYGTTVPAKVSTPGVTWSVSNTKYASISSKGVLKPKTVYNPVEVTVIAKSKDGAVKEEIPVTIRPKGAPVMVYDGRNFVTKTTRLLQSGETLNLQAFRNGEAIPATWKSSKPAVATVDQNGRVIAKAKGTATITATTADKKTATVTIKVLSPFRDMTITTKKGVAFEVASGKSLDLAATVRYQDGTKSTKVTWQIEEGAQYATISSGGKLTANKGLISAKTVTVTATATEGGWSVSKEIRILPLTTGVEIHGPVPTGAVMDISNTTQRWNRKQAATFKLTAKTVPNETMGVTWKSSNTQIVTVDSKGNVKCLKAGTVTITATAKDGSGKKATFKLTVY